MRPPDPEPTATIAQRPALDEVNDASFDSFPASDPPSWNSMHVGPPRPSVSTEVAEARRPLLSRAAALLPFGLVLTLLSLVVLQLLTNLRTEALRNRISTVTEPARALVTEIQSSLALEIASTRAYLLTGDVQSALTRARAKGERDDALARLLPLGEELGADITGTTNRLRADFRPADLLLDSLFDGRISRQEYLAQLDTQQSRFQNALSDMITLDNAIAQAAARSRSAIRATDRISVLVTAILVVLALAAALLVERLSRATASCSKSWARAKNVFDRSPRPVPTSYG